MIKKEFVFESGWRIEHLINRERLRRDILKRHDGFVSAEQLENLVKAVEFEMDNKYWDVINDKLGI